MPRFHGSVGLPHIRTNEYSEALSSAMRDLLHECIGEALEELNAGATANPPDDGNLYPIDTGRLRSAFAEVAAYFGVAWDLGIQKRPIYNKDEPAPYFEFELVANKGKATFNLGGSERYFNLNEEEHLRVPTYREKSRPWKTYEEIKEFVTERIKEKLRSGEFSVPREGFYAELYINMRDGRRRISRKARS